MADVLRPQSERQRDALEILRDEYGRQDLDAQRAWNEGDIERAYQALDDDVEYNLAPTWPEARPLRGRAEVVKFFRALRETFPDARAGPAQVVEGDERRVIVGFPVVGTGRASGVRIDIEI